MLWDTFRGPCRLAGPDGSSRARSRTPAPLPGGFNGRVYGSGSPHALGPDARGPCASVVGDLGRHQAAAGVAGLGPVSAGPRATQRPGPLWG